MCMSIGRGQAEEQSLLHNMELIPNSYTMQLKIILLRTTFG